MELHFQRSTLQREGIEEESYNFFMKIIMWKKIWGMFWISSILNILTILLKLFLVCLIHSLCTSWLSVQVSCTQSAVHSRISCVWGVVWWFWWSSSKPGTSSNLLSHCHTTDNYTHCLSLIISTICVVIKQLIIAPFNEFFQTFLFFVKWSNVLININLENKENVLRENKSELQSLCS